MEYTLAFSCEFQKNSWKSHPTKKQIDEDLPSIPSILKTRQIQSVGHCFRAVNEIISYLLLWSVATKPEEESSPVNSIISTTVKNDDDDHFLDFFIGFIHGCLNSLVPQSN